MNPTLENTLNLVLKNHKGQTDKQGRPYIRHLLNVVSNLNHPENPVLKYIDDNIIHVALLHDIIEDTTVNLEKLKELGYDEGIILAIDLLTKRSKTSYFDYIFKIKQSQVLYAVEVKKADLFTNLSDIHKLSDKDRVEKHLKYTAALAMLNC